MKRVLALAATFVVLGGGWRRAELETEALRQEGQRSWAGLVSGALLTLGLRGAGASGLRVAPQ